MLNGLTIYINSESSKLNKLVFNFSYWFSLQVRGSRHPRPELPPYLLPRRGGRGFPKGRPPGQGLCPDAAGYAHTGLPRCLQLKQTKPVMSVFWGLLETSTDFRFLFRQAFDNLCARRLRALSSLRGLRGAPAVPPLCRETQSLGQQMLLNPSETIVLSAFSRQKPYEIQR